jgi:hypothetical protein
MESTKRSFRVVAAFDSKGNNALALLKDTRLEIDATKGRMSQAGARAGSQLFRTLKCLQDKKASLPQRVVVMIQETTRASAKKKYGYSVEIGPVKKSNRPTDMPFEGTFQSTPTKMAIEEIERTKPSTKSSKTKATQTRKPGKKNVTKTPAAKKKAESIDSNSDSGSESD